MELRLFISISFTFGNGASLGLQLRKQMNKSDFLR